jgi:hypothetical protein
MHNGTNASSERLDQKETSRQKRKWEQRVQQQLRKEKNILLEACSFQLFAFPELLARRHVVIDDL